MLKAHLPSTTRQVSARRVSQVSYATDKDETAEPKQQKPRGSTEVLLKTDARSKLWKESFQMLAGENDFISVDQLGSLLDNLGFTFTEDEWVPYIYKKRIYFDNVCKVLQSKLKLLDFHRKLRNAFRSFDMTRRGYLSSQFLKHILLYMGNKLDEKEVKAIFDQFDIEDDDDEVDYEAIIDQIMYKQYMIMFYDKQNV